MTNENHQSRARSRAEAKYAFYKHLAVYLVVNVMLFLINLATSPGYFWSIWPFLGWGVAIVFHALSVFVFTERNQILDRMTEKEMRNEKSDEE